MAQDDKEKAADPSTPSPAHWAMAQRIAKMRAVLGGTETMREAGEELLPRYALETDEEYLERLAKSYFWNSTDLTLGAWVGKVFSEPLRYADRPGQPPSATLLAADPLHVVPPPIDPRLRATFSDIDLQGNSIDVFAREWFRTGMAFGVAPMLALLTRPVSTPPPGRQRTKKDDQLEAIRVYWRHIAPENILDCRVGERGGREVVTHLRVLGTRTTYEGFLTVLQRTITVYEPFKTTVWVERKSSPAGKVEWQAENPVPNDFDEVPLTIFYAEKEDTMVARSPSFDLADLNIRHWQSYSAQVNCLEVARFPMLAGSGVPDEQTVRIGNRVFLRSELPEAKFYYVEHGGEALASGEKDLEKLAEWMSTYGSSFLKKKVSHVTAADTVLSTAEATSTISDAACRFNDALAGALYHSARLMGIPEPELGALSVRTDYTEGETTPTDPETNDDRQKAPAAARKTGKAPQRGRK